HVLHEHGRRRDLVPLPAGDRAVPGVGRTDAPPPDRLLRGLDARRGGAHRGLGDLAGRRPAIQPGRISLRRCNTQPMRWLRAFLLVGAAQGYAIGLTGFVKPASIVGFPLETTPLNDRFVASFYLAGAIGLTLTALARRSDDMRVLLTAFSFVTLVLLVVTLAYWSEFTAKRVPYPW